MQLPHSITAGTRASALARHARGGLVAVTALALLGVGLAGRPAQADSLEAQQQRLEAAISQSNKALKDDAAAVAVSQQKLQTSQDKLAQQKQVLAQAQADVAAAQQRDRELASQLQAAQTALAVADKKVADGKVALAAQRSVTEVSLNQFVQQSNPLVNVALFTTNIGTTDLNQRAQWSKVSLSVNQSAALKLATLQRELEAAEKEQAAATLVAQQKKQESAEHLRTTQAVQEEAAAAAEAVAATVALNQAAADNAKAQQAAHRQTKVQLTYKAGVVKGKIAKKKAAERRAAAIRAARAKAAWEAAARKRAAAAAARREAAAHRRQVRAQARVAVAANKVATVSHRSSSVSRSSSRPSVSYSYTASSYSMVASYGGVDPWGFYWGQCVSYAAWKVRTTTSFSNFRNNYTYGGTSVHFGNAVEWAAAARAIGVSVNTHPTVGSIAWRASGSAGHVAYVTGVNGDGTINISEYNFLVPGGFDTRSHVVWWGGGSSGFDGFIHF